MGQTENQEISADALMSKLQAGSVAPLDNEAISLALSSKPVCDFVSLHSDVPVQGNIVFNSLIENLPQTASFKPEIEKLEVAYKNKHDLPGLG